MNPNLLRKIIIISFLSVPFLSAAISTYHLIDFFTLGNPSFVSMVLALTFEAGAIASFVSFAILDKINKFLVYFVFVILFIMQLIGNVYFSYDWASQMLLENPLWLNNFAELVNTLLELEPNLIRTKLWLALLIGIPIPLVSISFMKSLVDYLQVEPETKVETKEPEIQQVNTIAQVVPTIENEPEPEPETRTVEQPKQEIIEPKIENTEDSQIYKQNNQTLQGEPRKSSLRVMNK